jgi:uncharacterized protein (TIGR03086 family)
MAEFDARVRRTRDDQWENPTPCEEWTVRDLLDHLVTEQLWVPWLLSGSTLDDVGDRFDDDQLGDDPRGAWARASAAAREAWDTSGATNGEVHVTGGVIPAEDYGWQMTMDLAVHAWDLARGIGDDDALDPDLVEVLHTVFAPQLDSWQATGLFAAPRPVPDDADGQTRLLALLGRDR